MNTQELLSPVTPRSRPVVSFPASQSLQVSGVSEIGAISTGLSQLDVAICPPSTVEGDLGSRGISKGHVTEVFGPPGVGKTALALNIASNALRAGEKVIWIDTGSPLPRLRLRDVLQNSIQNSNLPQTVDDLVQSMTYIKAQSLPHLLAVLFHPPTTFPSKGCGLLVIDSASGPFPSYFPNPTELKSRLARAKITDKSQVQWLMHRGSNVTSDLANQLMKLATTHQMAILAVNQTRTKIRGQPRATLNPVLSGGSWETSIKTRILLYRDFPAKEEGSSRDIRYAEVMKRSGKMLALRADENIVPFVVETDGLRALVNHPSPYTARLSPGEGPQLTVQRKRKVEEIADSQDEDSDAEYGWIDGDDAGLHEK
ncbi:P-loop containing nucleoside triphosphate hydrolase protein [Aspergillus californicus]